MMEKALIVMNGRQTLSIINFFHSCSYEVNPAACPQWLYCSEQEVI